MVNNCHGSDFNIAISIYTAYALNYYVILYPILIKITIAKFFSSMFFQSTPYQFKTLYAVQFSVTKFLIFFLISLFIIFQIVKVAE